MLLFRHIRYRLICALLACLLLIPITQAYAQSALSLDETQNQQPVTPPDNVKANFNNKTVLLEWNDVTNPAITDYVIFRYDLRDPNKTVYTVGIVDKPKVKAHTIRYRDTTVALGHTYGYFIASRDVHKNPSANSRIATINTY